MTQIKIGIENGTLGAIELLPLNDSTHIKIEGVVKLKDDKILATMKANCISYIRQNPTMSYEMSFVPNQQSFRLQHNAIKYINEHNIFDRLIKSSNYNHDSCLRSVQFDKDYIFRYFNLFFFVFLENVRKCIISSVYYLTFHISVGN